MKLLIEVELQSDRLDRNPADERDAIGQGCARKAWRDLILTSIEDALRTGRGSATRWGVTILKDGNEPANR